MSIFYCNIPHFPVALARRERAELADRPLVLLGPEGRVLDASSEAAACGVGAGLTPHVAQVRCPEAYLVDADVVRCQEAREELLDVLDRFGTSVEPHGWGAAYVDLGDVVRDRQDAIALCSESGRAVRAALGQTLQPALGWNSVKFTSQAAARSTRPGRLLAIDAAREQGFLDPLPVALLPLAPETIQRLYLLGLRTLGQYAALPAAAVWQQFGRVGKRAHRYARGEDDRPVVSRHQARTLTAEHMFEVPADTRERLLAALEHVTEPLLVSLRERLQACGQVRLAVRFDDGSAEEKTRTFFVPVSESAQINRVFGKLLDTMRWPAGAISVSVVLEQIQEAVMEQLTFLPSEDERASEIQGVRRYLAARFGASRLWRAALVSPNAPLPEWRIAWQEED